MDGNVQVEGQEFGEANFSDLKDRLTYHHVQGLSENSPEDDPRTLGLHTESNGEFKVSYFVGQVWLDLMRKSDDQAIKVPLIIRPKGDGQVSYLKMIQRCFQNPTVCRHMEHCFYFWPDEPPMKAQLNLDCVRIFVIGMYLQALAELCKRNLRKDFVRVQENLTAKVKGRVLIKDNIRANSVRGRPDRMFCQYQKHNLDNKENQILLAALRQCQKEIRSNVNLVNGTPLQEWARMSDNALSGVSSRRVHPAEFQSLQLGGLKRAYKMPLQLARWILILFGSDPNQPPQEKHQKTEIPPFAINMNELFERFCEVKLRDSKEFDTIWAGYQDKNLGKDELKIRPDFVMRISENDYVVLDAKYKYGWKENILDNRYDVYQVVTYCRHCGTKSSDNEDCPKKAVIMSPAANNVQGNLNQGTWLKNNILDNDFKDPKIYHWQINLP